MLKGESLEMMAGMGEDEGEGYGDGDGDGEEKTIIMVDIRAISPAKTLRLLSSSFFFFFFFFLQGLGL